MENKSGQMRRLSNEEILEIITHRTGDTNDDVREPLSTIEVSEITGYARKTTTKRLRELQEEGYIKRKEAHPRGVVWWMDEDTEQSVLGARP